MWLTKEIREVLTFFAGLGGFIHELIIQEAERPFLLTASFALMGLPLVLHGEKKLREDK